MRKQSVVNFPISLTKPSPTIQRKLTSMSESQAEVEELSQSKTMESRLRLVNLSLRMQQPSATIWFSIDRERRSHNHNRK